VERSENRKSILSGPVMPVPASPLYGWFDTWDVTTIQSKTWQWTIPKDGMYYKLCNYNHAMMPTGWIASAIYLNDDIIFYEYSGYEIIWRPGSDNAPAFKYPDVLKVTIAHVYASYHVNHYWEMDFWREEQR